MKYKPGDMVRIYGPNAFLDDRICLPTAIKTEHGFELSITSDYNHSHFYSYLPLEPVFGLVLAYENEDFASLDGRRLFVMITLNGEPEYVRVVEDAEYLSKIIDDI